MATKQKKRVREDGYSYTIYEDGRYTHKIYLEDAKEKRYIPDGKDLGISHNGGFTTVVGPLNLEDLRALRKLIRKAIRNYESNEPLQI